MSALGCWHPSVQNVSMRTNIVDIDIDIFKSHMPPFAQEIVDIIGIHATVMLVAEYGGQTIALHRGPSRARLGELIGFELACKMTDRFCGVPITIPMCAAALKRARNKKIISACNYLMRVENVSKRKSIRTLCKEWPDEIHERTVWRILSDAA